MLAYVKVASILKRTWSRQYWTTSSRKQIKDGYITTKYYKLAKALKHKASSSLDCNCSTMIQFIHFDIASFENDDEDEVEPNQIMPAS